MNNSDELNKPSTHNLNDYVVYAMGCFLLNIIYFYAIGRLAPFSIFSQPMWFLFVVCLPCSYNIVLLLTHRSQRKCSFYGVAAFILLTVGIGFFNNWLINAVAASV